DAAHEATRVERLPGGVQLLHEPHLLARLHILFELERSPLAVAEWRADKWRRCCCPRLVAAMHAYNALTAAGRFREILATIAVALGLDAHMRRPQCGARVLLGELRVEAVAAQPHGVSSSPLRCRHADAACEEPEHHEAARDVESEVDRVESQLRRVES